MAYKNKLEYQIWKSPGSNIVWDDVIQILPACAPSSYYPASVVTDIENSTLAWEGLPLGVMDRCLSLHNELVRRVMRRYRGHESATEGGWGGRAGGRASWRAGAGRAGGGGEGLPGSASVATAAPAARRRLEEGLTTNACPPPSLRLHPRLPTHFPTGYAGRKPWGRGALQKSTPPTLIPGDTHAIAAAAAPLLAGRGSCRGWQGRSSTHNTAHGPAGAVQCSDLRQGLCSSLLSFERDMAAEEGGYLLAAPPNLHWEDARAWVTSASPPDRTAL
ncbi:MAG: hypothetical protein WDW36_004360 [Sanguina aurantia]